MTNQNSKQQFSFTASNLINAASTAIGDSMTNAAKSAAMIEYVVEGLEKSPKRFLQMVEDSVNTLPKGEEIFHYRLPSDGVNEATGEGKRKPREIFKRAVKTAFRNAVKAERVPSELSKKQLVFKKSTPELKEAAKKKLWWQRVQAVAENQLNEDNALAVACFAAKLHGQELRAERNATRKMTEQQKMSALAEQVKLFLSMGYSEEKIIEAVSSMTGESAEVVAAMVN